MERFIDQLPERLISRDTDNYRAGFVGYGPIASAPSAANYPAGAMWYDNEAALPWISEDGDWALTSYPDVGDYTILVDENGTILINSDYAVLVEA